MMLTNCQLQKKTAPQRAKGHAVTSLHYSLRIPQRVQSILGAKGLRPSCLSPVMVIFAAPRTSSSLAQAAIIPGRVREMGIAIVVVRTRVVIVLGIVALALTVVLLVAIGIWLRFFP